MDRKRHVRESDRLPPKKLHKGPLKIVQLDEEASSQKALIRSATASEFFCFRCNTGKTAKLQATWSTSQGDKTICNGCYGWLCAKSKKWWKIFQKVKLALARYDSWCEMVKSEVAGYDLRCVRVGFGRSKTTLFRQVRSTWMDLCKRNDDKRTDTLLDFAALNYNVKISVEICSQWKSRRSWVYLHTMT